MNTIETMKKANDFFTVMSMLSMIGTDDIRDTVEKHKRYHDIVEGILNLTEDTINHGTLLEDFVRSIVVQGKEEVQVVGTPEIIHDTDWVDTSALTIGMEVKNYVTLCKLLNQSPQEGNTKKAQMKNFKRYFDFVKVSGSQRIIITDIYDEPLPKDDKRSKGNHNIYTKYIEVILLQYLSKHEGYTCTLKKHQFWEILGMVNHKYKRISTNDLKKLDYCITDYAINHFYQRCDSKLSSILFDALKSLKRRCVLEYQEQTVYVDSNDKYHLATDADIKNILSVKKAILDHMGFSSEIQVYLTFKGNEFYSMVNSELAKRYGWKYTFKQYKMIYNKPDVIKEIPKIELELEREMLNDRVIETLNTSAEKNYKSVMEKQQSFKLPEFYCQAQRLLVDELIKIKSREKQSLDCDFSDLDELFGDV